MAHPKTSSVTGEIAHQPPPRQPYDRRDVTIVGAALAAAAVCALAANLLHVPGMQPLTGLIVIMTIAYCLSTNRRAIDTRTVAWGLSLQIVFALIVLRTAAGRIVFETRAGVMNGRLGCACAGPGRVVAPPGNWDARP